MLSVATPLDVPLFQGTPDLPEQPERYQGYGEGEMAGQRTEGPGWPLLLG